MNRRHFLSGTAIGLAGLAFPASAAQVARETILATMRRATAFMTGKVAHKGGYVWSYLPDLSRRWGEMEAKPSMIWIQDPGTVAMGNLFLDAFHATGEAIYWDAAQAVARALIRGQHPSGGWNYHIDTAGEASAKDWYETIGCRGMRLEEFRHYYGNATFDDGGTVDAGKFLLRMHLERGEKVYRAALDRVVDFVLRAQYPIGGWPQRYPVKREYSNGGRPDYTGHITFNDEVAINNTAFLALIYQVLGEERVLEPLQRGMSIFLLTQGGREQPAWALQYTLDLKPAGARSSEPPSVSTHTTVACIGALMTFYRWTGDTRYLARIPEALDWLDKMQLPPERIINGYTHPTFIEVGTNRALYLRSGGTWSGDQTNTVVYEPRDGGSWVNRKLNIPRLRDAYRKLLAMPLDRVTADSPLLPANRRPMPRYAIVHDVHGSDLNVGESRAEDLEKIVAELNPGGYWPTALRATSNPYRPDAEAAKLPPSRAANGTLMDARDTSPYITDTPVMGISTGTYINKMSKLIRGLV